MTECEGDVQPIQNRCNSANQFLEPNENSLISPEKPKAISIEDVTMIDSRTKCIVIGYIRSIQQLLSKKKVVHITPKLVIYWCMLYFDDTFETITQNLNSSSIKCKLRCVQKLKIMITNAHDKSLTMSKVTDSDIFSRVIDLTQNFHHPQIQFEALSILKQINPEKIHDLIKPNLLIKICSSSPYYQIKQYSLEILEKIAKKNCDLLNDEILSMLSQTLQLKYNQNYMINFEYYPESQINRLCPLISLRKQAIATLCSILSTHQTSEKYPASRHFDADKEMLGAVINQIKQLVYCSNSAFIPFDISIEGQFLSLLGLLTFYNCDEEENDGVGLIMEELIEEGMMQRIMMRMDCNWYDVRMHCVQVFGMIIHDGNDEVRDKCIKLGILNKCYNVLTIYCENNNDESVNKERMAICWLVSNVTAGTAEHVSMVEKCGLFPILCNYLADAKYEATREALLALAYAVINGDEYITDRLVNKYGLIKSLHKFLMDSVVDTFCGMIITRFMKKVLVYGQQDGGDKNEYKQKFQDEGMVECLKKLAEEGNNQLKEKSNLIIKSFFS